MCYQFKTKLIYVIIITVITIQERLVHSKLVKLSKDQNMKIIRNIKGSKRIGQRSQKMPMAPMVYFNNLTAQSFMHQASIPGTFYNKIHKIESVILIHPYDESLISRGKQEESSLQLKSDFREGQGREPEFDQDCLMVNKEEEMFKNYDNDMFCAAELDCKLKRFGAEIEQRPKPNKANSDQLSRPKNALGEGEDGGPLPIVTRIFVESISDISEVNMDFTCTITLTHDWSNELLVLPSGRGDHSILLPEDVLKNNKVWLPDVILLGTKSSFIQETIQVNKAVRLFTRTGQVRYTVKLTATLSCTMKLKTFPEVGWMSGSHDIFPSPDVELCSIGIHTFSYTDNELRLIWPDDLKNASQVIHDSINHLTKFELKNLYIRSDSAPDINKPPILTLYFEFRRFLLSVIFQSYLPAILMVLLAGFSMWIDAKSVPARVTLCVTTVLTIITIIASLKSTMPKVSYLTALDYYVWISFIFVLSTVIEYTVLNTLMNKKLRKIQESLKNPGCSTKIKDMKIKDIEDGANAETSYNYYTETHSQRRRNKHKKGGLRKDWVPALQRRYSFDEISLSCSSDESPSNKHESSHPHLVKIRRSNVNHYDQMIINNSQQLPLSRNNKISISDANRNECGGFGKYDLHAKHDYHKTLNSCVQTTFPPILSDSDYETYSGKEVSKVNRFSNSSQEKYNLDKLLPVSVGNSQPQNRTYSARTRVPETISSKNVDSVFYDPPSVTIRRASTTRAKKRASRNDYSSVNLGYELEHSQTKSIGSLQGSRKTPRNMSYIHREVNSPYVDESAHDQQVKSMISFVPEKSNIETNRPKLPSSSYPNQIQPWTLTEKRGSLPRNTWRKWKAIFTMDPNAPGIDPGNAIQLDVFFRRGYMFLFLVFNVCYWLLLAYFSAMQSKMIEEKFKAEEKMNIDFLGEDD